jgi:hypothetical protein
MRMDTWPDWSSQAAPGTRNPGSDTLPDLPAIVDGANGQANSDGAGAAPRVPRRGAIGQAARASAEFAKAAPEMVLQFIEGLVP